MARMLVALCGIIAFLLTGCEGSQTGKSIFGTPSNNVVSLIKLTFPTAPNRAQGPQYIALEVDAYDQWNNLITVGYNNSITLSSTGNACEIGFSFYQNLASGASTPPPAFVSLTYNTPQEIGVFFNPSCGPDPVVITASVTGVPNGVVSF